MAGSAKTKTYGGMTKKISKDGAKRRRKQILVKVAQSAVMKKHILVTMARSAPKKVKMPRSAKNNNIIIEMSRSAVKKQPHPTYYSGVREVT